MSTHAEKPRHPIQPQDSSDLPFRPEELGTEGDIAQRQNQVEQFPVPVPLPAPIPVPLPVAVEKNVAEKPKKPVPNCPFILFHYQVHDEQDTRPERYFTNLIRQQIDAVRLVPGNVGALYEIEIDLTPLQNDLSITRVWLAPFMVKLGFQMEHSNTKIRVFGVPHTSFPQDGSEGKMIFGCKRENKQLLPTGNDTLSYSQYPKPFLINPDPRSLWNDLPVDDDEGYPKPNTDLFPEDHEIRGIPPKNLDVFAASVRGRSHAHVGKPRDDHFYMEFDEPSGWNFVAVADGAGSAKFSRKGSEIACETVVKTLRSLICPDGTDALKGHDATLDFWRRSFNASLGILDSAQEQEFRQTTQLGNIFHKAVYESFVKIHEEAQRRGAVLKDYHTTLLCAALKYYPPTGDTHRMSGWFIISYWVGDGGAAILHLNSSNRVLVLGEPDGGEFAGQTRFLTMKDEITAEAIHKRLRFTFCDSFDALILVTDGITDPFFPSEAAVTDESKWLDFYDHKLKHGCEEEREGCGILDDPSATPHQKAAALLKWLNFWSKGNHDDRTILMVHENSSRARSAAQ